MSEEEKLELLKFHWDKWRQEANRFWKHLAFATIALLAMNLYQLNFLQFDFVSAKLVAGTEAAIIKKWLICPISCWLWLSILFDLVDFLRHRVPEQFESSIHNNTLLVPGLHRHLNLKIIGRWLYGLIVVLYLGILGFWVVYCSVKVWKC